MDHLFFNWDDTKSIQAPAERLLAHLAGEVEPLQHSLWQRVELQVGKEWRVFTRLEGVHLGVLPEQRQPPRGELLLKTWVWVIVVVAVGGFDSTVPDREYRLLERSLEKMSDVMFQILGSPSTKIQMSTDMVLVKGLQNIDCRNFSTVL